MKTTIELNDERLKRVMELTGLKTKKSAIDAALRHLERQELKKRLLSERISEEDWADALDPDYDLDALRKREIPAGEKP